MKFKKKTLLTALCIALTMQNMGVIARADDDEPIDTDVSVSGSAEKLSGNMLMNGSFDNDGRWWNIESTPGVEWQKEGCMKISPASRGAAISQNIQLVENESYTVSVRLKGLEKNSTMSIYVKFFDGGYQRIGKDLQLSKDKWTTYEGTFFFGGKNSLSQPVSGLGYVMLQFEYDGDVQNYLMDDFEIRSYQNVCSVEQKEADVDEPIVKNSVKFSDMSGHWAEDTVSYMSNEGLVHGTSEGVFSPDDVLTRAQFLKMLVCAKGVDTSGYSQYYNDVAQKDWFSGYITAAADSGIIYDGFANGKMLMPNEPIMREEAVALLVNSIGEAEGATDAQYIDYDEVSPELKGYISSAVAAGLVVGDGKGRLKPKEILTRAEGAELVKRLAQKEQRCIFYVDAKKGNDNNNGTKSEPFKSIKRAQEAVREINSDMDRNIYVYLSGGEHKIDDTVEFTSLDSGNNGYKVYYIGSTTGERTVISGGEHFGGWEMDNVKKNIYKAYVGKGIGFRQLYIDGMRAERASKKVDYTEYVCNKNADGGFFTTDDTLYNVENVTDVEFQITAEWYWVNAGLESVEKLADGRYKVSVDAPMWEILRGKSRAWRVMVLDNSYSFLDEPGEWFYDKYDGYVYYIPRPFEIMAEVDAVYPKLLDLMTVKGENADSFVQNISFSGVDFQYATWDRVGPDKANLSAQNDLIDDENGGYRKHRMTPAAVTLEYAAYIDFEDCKFSKIGQRGMLFSDGTRYSNITGCKFYDISSAAIQIGRFEYDSVNPVDKRRMVTGNNITNNYVHSVCNEYRGAGAISGSYPNKTHFDNNEIFDVPYVGYHIGYGWHNTISSVYADTTINDNYIHGAMRYVYDGGGIYLLGRTGGTEENPIRVERNYIHDQTNTMDKGTESYRLKSVGLYSDRGTSHTYWKNNVFDVSDSAGQFNNYMSYDSHNLGVVYEDNYVTDEYYRVSVYEDNTKIISQHVDPEAKWDETAQAVIKSAGIKDKYINNFKVDIQQIRLNFEEIDGKIGEKYQIEVTGEGRKKKKFDMSDRMLYFTTTNKDVADVDKDGLITLKSQGEAKVSVWYTYDEYMMKKDIIISSGDEVRSLILSGIGDSVSSRSEAKISVKGATLFGRDKSPEKVVFENLSPDFINVSEKGIVTAVDQDKGGQVSVNIIATFEDKVLTKQIEFELAAYKYGSGEKFDEENVKVVEIPKDVSQLSELGGVKLETYGEELAIKNTKNNAFVYYNKQITDELVTVRMTPQDSTRWSAITVRGNKQENFLKGGEEYALIFTGKGVELSRFNDGVRTGIYSSTDNIEILGAPSYPSEIFASGTTHEVQFGAIDTAEGVRLILNIDGINIFDFTDTTEGRITGGGYYKIYPNGSDIYLGMK